MTWLGKATCGMWKTNGQGAMEPLWRLHNSLNRSPGLDASQPTWPGAPDAASALSPGSSHRNATGQGAVYLSTGQGVLDANEQGRRCHRPGSPDTMGQGPLRLTAGPLHFPTPCRYSVYCNGDVHAGVQLAILIQDQ